MDTNRWQDLKSIFNEALKLEGAKRQKYLQEACGDDQQLRQEVLSLLNEHKAAGKLDQPPGKLLNEVFFEQFIFDKSREQIGPFQVIESIGYGGMGNVYLAKRTDGQFEQIVALKLLRTGFTTGNQKHRFLAERQILATLNHKNIAKLLDGGVMEDGQPWFAMEYIEGQPIDRYCDTQKLTIDQRLKLFLDVCDAVQSAHQKLIVHRDLKPSNILVTESGTVKLLDFGIAKALNQDDILTTSPPHTRTGLLPLTPAYASPEQILNNPITTASDIYQLGMVLFELLSGCRPYTVSGKSPSEIEQIICEQKPTRPSTAITKILTSPKQTAGILKKVSQARNTKADNLHKTLKGDLDTIVLKALRKEPERRYESAEQLAIDIRNYLKGQPVNSHPDSIWYRTGKFVRRHSIGVAASSIIILLLIGYTTTITWHSQRTQAALITAEQETKKAKQVTDFLLSLFEASNPAESLGDTVTARLLLERGIKQANELKNQPELQAQMLDVSGLVYMNLGQYEQAQSLLKQAYEIRRVQFEPPHPEISESLHNIGVLLWEKGRYNEAEKYLRDALEMLQVIHEQQQEHESVANTMVSLAIVLKELRKFEEAELLYLDALEMNRNIFGDTHEAVAQSLNNLGNFLESQGEYREAENYYRESLEMYMDVFGNNHPKVAGSLTNLGRISGLLGKLEISLFHHQKALNIKRSLYDNDHPDIAKSLYNMGNINLDREDYSVAEQQLEEALAIQRNSLDSFHPNVSKTLNTLGILMQRKGNFEASEQFYQEALTIQKARLGENHSEVGIQLNNLGLVYIRQKRFEEAMEHLEKSRDIMLHNFDDNHPLLTYPLLGIAHVYLNTSKPEKAEPLLRKSLEIQKSAVGEDHWMVGLIKSRLGRCLTDMKVFKKAEPWLIEGHKILVENLGESHERTKLATKNLITLYENWDNPDKTSEYQQLLAETDAQD